MASEKLKTVLHPVRIQIIHNLQGRQLTPYQINALMSKTPPATLYRHIKHLCEAGIIRVVSERKVHGATESVYEVVDNAGRVTPAEFAAIPIGEHRNYFHTFMGGIVGMFDRYADQKPSAPHADGLRYFCGTLYATDEEFQTVWSGIHSLLEPIAANGPGPGRVRRLVALQSVPAVEAVEDASGDLCDANRENDR